MDFVSSLPRHEFGHIILRSIFCPSQAREVFGQHKFRCISCSWIDTGWSTQVEIYVLSSLAWDGFGLLMLRCGIRLVIVASVSRGRFEPELAWEPVWLKWQSAGLEIRRSEVRIPVLVQVFLMRPYNVVMHFVYSLAWKWFGQYIFRSIFFLLGMG